MADIEEHKEGIYIKFNGVAGISNVSVDVDRISILVDDSNSKEFQLVEPEIRKMAAPYEVDIYPSSTYTLY